MFAVKVVMEVAITDVSTLAGSLVNSDSTLGNTCSTEDQQSANGPSREVVSGSWHGIMGRLANTTTLDASRPS